jgi:murein DD-endopeptidase MepM/ murein hydrolase activator NlpD
MRARRYTFVIADRQTGAVRRLTISLWPTLAGIAGVFALPILIGLGARWSARATIADLQSTTALLQVENANYRAATGQLAGQISELQSAVDNLGQSNAVDSDAKRAMDRLPAVVKSRAMGGAPNSVVAPMLKSGFGSTDVALTVLSNLLGAMSSRLETVRDSVERRHMLAAATPSIWPISGYLRLTSNFGSRKDPFDHETAFHPGLDISADYGAPVLATADGTVTSAGYDGPYGNMIVLDHGFGISTKYGHLSRIAVTETQQVKRGQTIGYVGSTGRSTGPHLHYEIWMDEHLTNPMNLLGPTDLLRH